MESLCPDTLTSGFPVRYLTPLDSVIMDSLNQQSEEVTHLANEPNILL